MKPRRDELLSHEADGIREFDNALPRWWLYGFYFTIAFALVYVVNYHVLPEPAYGRSTLVAEYQDDVEAAKRLAGNRPASSGAAIVALTDPASLEKGKAIFESADSTCFACHRPDLGGLVGPNLTDGYWMHGCTVEAIAQNIKTGFPLKGMLAFGTGKVLTDEQLAQLASYILSKRGSNPPNPKAMDPDSDKACG